MNSELILLTPDGQTLTAADNSFTSNWADKRSAPFFGISVVFRGNLAIAGTLHFQFSNIPAGGGNQIVGGGSGANPSQGISGSQGNPDDAQTLTSADIAVSTLVGFGTAVYQWNPSVPYGAHWVRVVYKASGSATGITASVYFNGVFSS